MPSGGAPFGGELPRQIAVPPALRCPKKSSHYSFARFFRPLRILCLASSATGGARLRIPLPRDSPPSQALTPRERHPRFLIARPSEPLSRHRERGWGERADTPVATLGAILCAVRIEFRLPPKFNPYPALQATGVLGQSPKRVLVPFTRVKGTPRRRAVQIKTFYTTCPTEGDYKLLP